MDSSVCDWSRQLRRARYFLGLAICWFIGCASAEAPQFTPGADVAKLATTAETEDDKKVARELQAEIANEMTKECGVPLAPKALPGAGISNERLAEGSQIFARRCQPCHGVNGDGAGPVSKYLKPLPRDYTKGIFKFVSTPLGSRPTRSDLLRTLRRGVTGTSMPSFADLAPEDLEAVVDYVIYLSQRGQLEHELAGLAEQEQKLDPEGVKALEASVVSAWQPAALQAVMPVTPMPRFTPETIAKGKALFEGQACNKCHGLDGRGGTFGGVDVGKDVWGHTAAAADLTSGMFHGGGRPIDIYRRIYGGINGTPMPGFATAFEKAPENIWYLVHFIRDMGERRRRNLPPIQAPGGGSPPKPASPPAGQPAGSSATPNAAAIGRSDAHAT